MASHGTQEERQRQLEAIIEAAMQRTLQAVAAAQPRITHHTFHGAVGIDPQHLATWYIFKTDAELLEAARNGLLGSVSARTRAELRAGGYPDSAIEQVGVSFTSAEDIERAAGGNWYQYFK